MAARLLLMLALAAVVRTAVSCGNQSSKKSKGPTRYSGYCYVYDRHQYLQFGDATKYLYARSKIERKDCEVISLWMLARHGSHYPDSGDYKRFKKLDEIKMKLFENDLKGDVAMCEADVDNLRKISLVLPANKAGQLSELGREEFFDLGHRLSHVFSELTEYVPDQLNGYKFISANTPSVRESAEYFIKGLGRYKGFNCKHLITNPANQNIIASYATCRKWQVATNKYKENSRLFQDSTEMQKVLSNVAFRLGMKPILNMEYLFVMYDACRLQKTLVSTSIISPWCAVFRKEELEVLEYNVDLYYYYKSGPGNVDLHKKLACPAIKSMIDTFRKGVSSPKGSRPSVFYFGDQIMLDILQVGLGLTFPGIPLAPDNYNRQSKRNYRTSKTMPVGGNILAALYRCNGKEKVEFYRNEERIENLQFQGCNGGSCDWKIIEERFGKYVDSKSCTDMSWCNAA